MKMFKGQIEWEESYRLEVSEKWFRVYDEYGNETYLEYNNGFWMKRECDEYGNEEYYENSEGVVIDNRKKDVTLKLTE